MKHLYIISILQNFRITIFPFAPSRLCEILFKYLFIVILQFFITFNVFSNDEEWPLGVVIDTVVCEGIPGQSYALYLPSNYHPYDKWPIIYAFDPGARGSLPVELYSEAAEKFGYIVVGSNNSENGAWEPIHAAIKAMIHDTEKRFPIDRERVYTTGFSGGARVATTVGVIVQDIAGVIGCGAGFSATHPPSYMVEYKYLGLIGNQDFNYQEMWKVDKWLKQFDIEHYIYEFSGGHDWPPKHVLTDAVRWFEFRDLETQISYLRDERPVDDFIARHQESIDLYAQEGNLYAILKIYQKMISYVGELRETLEWEQIVNDLLHEKSVKHELAAQDRTNKKEQEFQSQLDDAYYAIKAFDYDLTTIKEPPSWWKKQLKSAYKYINNSKTEQDSIMGYRLLDYINQISFIHYLSVINTPNHTLAPQFLEVWALSQPDNPAPDYYLSRYFSQYGHPNKSINYLEKSVAKGFNNTDFLQQDSLMNPIKGTERYQEIIEGLERVEE